MLFVLSIFLMISGQFIFTHVDIDILSTATRTRNFVSQSVDDVANLTKGISGRLASARTVGLIFCGGSHIDPLPFVDNLSFEQAKP